MVNQLVFTWCLFGNQADGGSATRPAKISLSSFSCTISGDSKADLRYLASNATWGLHNLVKNHCGSHLTSTLDPRSRRIQVLIPKQPDQQAFLLNLKFLD